MKSARALAAAVLCAASLSACQVRPVNELTPEQQAQLNAYLADKPAQLRSEYARLWREGPGNAVLNNMKLGTEAMRRRLFADAERAFDTALDGIETIYADNDKAEQARSLWYEEKVKDFKGEPHERMMAYYYRGLLYLRVGDYDNARAAFKAAMLQDSFAERERFRSDTAAVVWLEGWAARCAGDVKRAGDLFQEAGQLRDTLEPPPPGDTLLVVAESGGIGHKITSGQFNERLQFKEGNKPLSGIEARRGALVRPLMVAEDVYFQATSRGGRPIDVILAGKAQFKGTAAAIGDVALQAGVMAAGYGAANHDRRAAGAGLAFLVVGLIAHASAAAANPAADNREWSELPHNILLTTLPGGTGPINITDSDGQSVLLN
ncbi:MAG: hypothetical protein K2Q10_14795, partial [Rhodospirillales bacterium]|nr:hypothetical protein [Rhodospirillales bacterium]